MDAGVVDGGVIIKI